MFSVFMLDPSHGWIAVHRLPFEDAIHYAKEFLKQMFNSHVALVPDCEDPEPYLRHVEQLTSIGHFTFA